MINKIINKLFNQKILTILYLLGSVLIVLGILLLFPFFISLYYQEGIFLYKSFLIPAFITIILGIGLTQINIKEINMNITTGMIVCSLGWILTSIIGAIPFYIILEASFLDSIFESVSGFTTTGITVFTNLKTFPHSLIFWRSLIQWLGGLGILTFFLFITFRSEGQSWQLFTAESHKFNSSRPVPNIFKSITILWSIYILLTFCEVILLVIFQVDLFEAVIHSFTTLSTGGFSNFDSSISYFQLSGYPHYQIIEYIIIFFMLLGGINFLVHYKVLKGEIKEFFINFEMKYFWGIIIVTLLLIMLGHYTHVESFSFENMERVFRKSLFQVVSVMTTTGYTTEAIGSEFFSGIARQLFLLLMLIGGCVGSTAGGIKVIRIAILNKLFFREINKFYLPDRAQIPVTIDKKIISFEEIYKVAGLFFSWLLLLAIGSAITVFFSNLTPMQSISGMFSAVNNIGPFYFSVEKMQSLSPIIKITYIIGMLAGRLEILPVVLLFNKNAWK